MRFPLKTAALALALPLFAACASTPDTAPGEGETMETIVVDNSRNAIADATIYLVPETGVRTRLGSITLGDRETFEVNAESTFNYQLVLESGRDELVSPRFILANGDAVTWDLNLNRIRRGGTP